MAGTIIADYIRTDANKLSLNVGNTTFATINAMGLLSNTGVQIINQNGQINAASIAAGTIPASALSTISRSSLPSGASLQSLQTWKVDTFSTTNNSWTDVTGLSVAITPTSTSNKILVICNFSVGSDSNNPDHMVRLARDSTAIALGNNGGTDTISKIGVSGATDAYKTFDNTIIFLDSPSTVSSVTYKLQVRNWSATNQTLYIGRRALNSSFIIPSSITVMEIAG